jgi:hypothetical protein
MPVPSRTAPCAADNARSRLRTARAYLDVARLVLDENNQNEYLNVAAGLANLAGIAASDSICCARLRRRHHGHDHRGEAAALRWTDIDFGAGRARVRPAQPAACRPAARCSGYRWSYA